MKSLSSELQRVAEELDRNDLRLKTWRLKVERARRRNGLPRNQGGRRYANQAR